MVRNTSFIFVAMSLMLALASPAFAAKPPKPPAYSSAKKIAMRYAPSADTRIADLKSGVPDGMRGFEVFIGSRLWKEGPDGSCGTGFNTPVIQVLVARSSPSSVVIVNYIVSGSRLYSRGGFAGDPYMQSWSFIGPDGQAVSDPGSRQALRSQFFEGVGQALSLQCLVSVVTASQGPDSGGVFPEGRTWGVYAAAPAAGLIKPVFSVSGQSLPATASDNQYLLSASSPMLDSGAMLACGSRVRLSLTVQIASPTTKRPDRTRPYRYKAPPARVLCL